MKRMSRCLIVLLLCVPSTAGGVEKTARSFPPAGDESAQYLIDTVITGLANPCGLVAAPNADKTVPPETLFAESGAGRVLGFKHDRPREAREVLTGLTVDDVAELNVRASVWSLGFVTPTKLAVLGRSSEGMSRVEVFILPAEERSIKADRQDHSIILPARESTGPALAFPSMAFAETSAYVSSGLVDGPGQVFRAGLAANRIESPQPLLNTAVSRELRWSTGLCLSRSQRLKFLLVAFAGTLAQERDSRVAFLSPTSGKVALELTPGLIDVVGLAYSPSGQLYAIDLAWEDTRAGGVYRLDDARFEGQPACRAVKIAEVARPTSLLFGDGGTLFVTAWGESTDAKNGTVLKITGEF